MNSFESELIAPKGPFAQLMLKQIRDCRNEGEYESAVAAAEEGIRFFGEEEAFLYEIALCSYNSGDAEKAAQIYEKLCALFPEKTYYLFRMAFVCTGLGIYEKATTYFMKLFSQIALGNGTEYFTPASRSLLAFLKGCGTELNDSDFHISTLFTLYGAASAKTTPDEKLHEKITAEFKKYLPDENMDSDLKKECSINKLNSDERIRKSLRKLAAVLLSDPSDFQDIRFWHFLKAESTLFFMEESKDGLLDEIKILNEFYPEAYSACENLILIRLNGDTPLETYRKNLIKHYQMLAETTRSSMRFFEAYPDRKPSEPPARTMVQNGPVTIKKSLKISRNAPCPCGSGKKYKKCCGK